jgi:XTP/dITP diphosphohydrolase
MPISWVLASGNPGKLREMRALLAPLNLSLISQSELGVQQPPETAVTFIENVLAKARHACAQTGLPAIADDSGLAVAALGGQPGVRSARYGGEHASDEDNVLKLLAAMADLPDNRRDACFHCVVVAMRQHDDPAPLLVQGTWRGRISREPLGHSGFGYDPVFIGEGSNLTAAQLSAAAKNRVSHRGKALAALVEALAATR